MPNPSSTLRELARLLLAARPAAEHSVGSAGVSLVNENLRRSLIEFAGAEGFVSLLRRAVALASAQTPALRMATVRADGRIEGVETQVAQESAAWESTALAVTEQMLELLVTFIGERLTRQLVREACSDVPPSE